MRSSMRGLEDEGEDDEDEDDEFRVFSRAVRDVGVLHVVMSTEAVTESMCREKSIALGARSNPATAMKQPPPILEPIHCDVQRMIPCRSFLNRSLLS